MLGEVPAIGETALPGYDVSTWFGLVAPAGTPREIVARINAAIVKGLAATETRERLLAQGIEPLGSTPAEFSKLLRDELPKWANVVKVSGARID